MILLIQNISYTNDRLLYSGMEAFSKEGNSTGKDSEKIHKNDAREGSMKKGSSS